MRQRINLTVLKFSRIVRIDSALNAFEREKLIYFQVVLLVSERFLEVEIFFNKESSRLALTYYCVSKRIKIVREQLVYFIILIYSDLFITTVSSNRRKLILTI